MTPNLAAAPATLVVDLNRAVLAFSQALDFIGVDAAGHGRRVALMAATCARAMDWDPKRIHQLVLAALMHDCGVSSTREHRALLNDITWDGEHAHCERGFAYVAAVPPLAHLAPVILEHHTPWAELQHRGIDAGVAEAANLIHLVDRADALKGRGVLEWRTLFEILGRYEGSDFAPELLAVFREVSDCEAFWFALEEPALSERVEEVVYGEGCASETMALSDVKALAGVFGRIVDAKSPFTERHSLGVVGVALRLGRRFGLPETTLELMEVSALLHDLGKLRVPDELLEKHGPLTAEERRRMARHAFDTYEILRHVFGDGPVAQWAAYHHEYVSGQGYPFHRHEGDLPLEARIIAVADVLQALAQKRPYRQPLKPEDIVAILDGMVFGGKLDRDVVAAVKEDLDRYWKDAVAQEGVDPSS